MGYPQGLSHVRRSFLGHWCMGYVMGRGKKGALKLSFFGSNNLLPTCVVLVY